MLKSHSSKMGIINICNCENNGFVTTPYHYSGFVVAHTTLIFYIYAAFATARLVLYQSIKRGNQ